MAGLFLVLNACAANQPHSATPEEILAGLRAGPPVTADQVWPLERSGPSPLDTTVRFSKRIGRKIVLRHGAPDNAIFVIVEFAPDSTAGASDSLDIGVRPLPAAFGFTLTGPDSLGKGVTASFSYAQHFVMPGDAITRYPTPVRFEQMLTAMRTMADGKLVFLLSEHVAADILRFPLAGSGTYLLAAPK